jgi:hypothetical protein
MISDWFVDDNVILIIDSSPANARVAAHLVLQTHIRTQLVD